MLGRMLSTSLRPVFSKVLVVAENLLLLDLVCLCDGLTWACVSLPAAILCLSSMVKFLTVKGSLNCQESAA